MPTAKKSSFKIGSIKNWLILIGAGVGGYYVYTKYIQPELGNAISDAKNLASKKPGVAEPDLNGPVVSKFMIASTKSKICVDRADKRFAYAPITSTNMMTGYQTFSAPVAGHFTRRLLCTGGRRWAEIKPG